MPKLSYLKALNRALADEMERDENIILLGEDIKLGLTNALIIAGPEVSGTETIA